MHRDTTPRSITTQQKSLIYKNNIQYGKRLFEHACSYFVLLVQILDFFSILGVEQTSKEI